eukprot:403376643
MQTLQNASITHGIDEEYIEITGLQQKANKIDTHNYLLEDPLGEFQTFTAQTEDQLNQCKRDIQLTGFDGDSSKNILTTGKQTYGSDCAAHSTSSDSQNSTFLLFQDSKGLTQLFKTQNLNEQIFSNPMIKSDYFFYTTTVLSINATAINKVLIAKVRKGTWILEEKSFPDRLIMSDSQKTIDEVQLYRRSETQNAVLITLINTLDDTSEGVIFFFDDNFANVKSYKYSYFGGDGASFRILGMALFDTEPVSTLLYKHKISTTDYLSLYQTVSDKQELTRFLRVTLQSPFTAASNNADIKHAQDTTATNGRFYFAYLAAQNNQLNIFLGQQGSNMESDLQISSSYSTSVELETVQIMELSTDNIYFGGPSKSNPTWKYLVLHVTISSNVLTFNKLLTVTSLTLAESLISPKFFMALPSTAILYSAFSKDMHQPPYSHVNIIIYKSIEEVLQLPETEILLANVLTIQAASHVTNKTYNTVEKSETNSNELEECQGSTIFSQDGFVYLNETNLMMKNYQKSQRFLSAPIVNVSTLQTPATVRDQETKTWKVQLNQQGETASFAVDLLDGDQNALAVIPNWWSVESPTDTYVEFSVTTPDLDFNVKENYIIRVSIRDSQNLEPPNVYTIALTVTSENRAPTKKNTVNLNLGTITVMSGDSLNLVNTRDFVDLDEHDISIDCTYQQSTATQVADDYIIADKAVDGIVQTVTFKENPSYIKPTGYSQDLAGDYSFICVITDDFTGTSTETFIVTVAQNTEVVAVTSKITATIDNQTATVQSATVSFDTKCTSDEEDVLYDLKYDGTSVTDAGNTLNGKVTFDTSTMLITYFNSIEPISSDGGSTYDPYVLTLECTDPFHPTAQTVTVEITVVDSDKHPIIVNAQADVEVLYSLTSTYVIVDRDDFSDNTTILSYAIVGAGFKSGPDNTDFEVSLDASYTGEGVKFLISGLSFERDDAYGATVNKIQAYVAVTDDANPEQTIYSEFFIVPIQCHAECYTCTGLANNECSSCDQLGTNYLTDLNTCGACENNQYDDTNWVCQDCDDLCTTCTSFGTDTVTNECACALKTHGTTCLDACPASTHDRQGICDDNVVPTITNAGADQTKSIRKDDTYSWTLTAGDIDVEDSVTLAIKSVTKKTPIQEVIAVNNVNDKWLYIISPPPSSDDFTIEFKDYKDNGEVIALDETISYDVELEATDSLGGTATYTIALTVTSENRAPTKKNTVNLNLGTITVMSGDSLNLVNTRDFVDLDEHDISIDCTYQQSTATQVADDYIIADKAVDGIVQTVTFKENPSYIKPTGYSQDLAGDYSFICVITDDFTGTSTETFIVTVAQNTEVVAVTSKITATIDNQTATVQSATVSFDTKCTSDEEDVLYDLKYDGTSVTDAGNTLNGKVTFDTSTMLITYFNSIEPISSDGGSTYDPYVLTLECTDPFHPTAQTVTVEITVVDSDKHPIIVNAQADVEVLYSLTSTYVIVDRDDFSDNTTILSYAIVGAGFKSGPDNTDFEVSLDASYTGEGVKFLISGLSFERDDAYGATVNKIQAYVAVTDDANPEQTIYSEFFIVPIQCHAECYTCTGLANNECSSCDQLGTNYLTDLNTCGACENNQYDDTNWVCQDCDDLCTTCTSFGTDTVTNECACALKTHGTTCLDACPASTHDRQGICDDNVVPTITNAGADQTKSIRKDDTYSWTLTAGDIDVEDSVTLAIKSVTKKTPIQEVIAVNNVNDKWLYIISPPPSSDDFTIEFKDYKDNGEVIALDETISYDVELEATDSLGGTATYTIALTVTSENRAPTKKNTVNLNLGTITVMSGDSLNLVNTRDFVDLDEHDISIDCTYQQSTATQVADDYIIADKAVDGIVQTVTFKENPSYIKPTGYSQDLAGDYSFICVITDDFTGTSTETFIVTVAQNTEVVAVTSKITATIDNQTATVQSATVSFDTKCTSDEEDVLYDLKYDGTSVTDAGNTLNGKVTFDTSTMLITYFNSIEPISSDGGSTYDPYVLTLECTDPFHPTAQTVTVEITVVDSDKHPIIVNAQADVEVLYSLTSTYVIVDRDDFSDNTTILSYAIVGAGFKSGPDNTDFEVSLDASYTGEGVKFLISGLSFERDDAYGATVNKIQAYVAVTDDANPEQTIYSEFFIVPIQCHAECYTCTGLANNECSSCDQLGTNYLTDLNTCGACENNQYDDTNWVCQDCDDLCTTCTSFGTDTVTNECACALKTHGTTCLDACPASTHDRQGICDDNVVPTITNAGADQTKSIRKDDTYSWTLTAGDIDVEDSVTLAIKSVTKKTPIQEVIAVNNVNDKWLYIISPPPSSDDFTIEFKDYKDNGEVIALDETISYDVELEATDSLGGTATYTIALTVTSENRAPTKKNTVNLNLGTITVMSGDSLNLVNTRDFVDLDEHDISIDCTYQQSTATQVADDYIIADKAVDGIVQTVTFKENPSYIKPTGYSQDLAGDYSFICVITDDFTGTSTETFIVTVAQNTEVVAVTSKITATIDNQTATVQSATVSFDTKCTSDEEDVLYDLKYDGTSVTDAGNTLNGKVTFDTSTMLITYFNSIEPISSDGGSTYDPYVLTLECTDPFHPTAQTQMLKPTLKFSIA